MSNSNDQTNARFLIQARQSGKKSTFVGLVKQNPDLAAQISKLTTATRPPLHDSSGQRAITTPPNGQLQQISAAISQKDSDAETLMQLFPELKLACEIMISSIISPNDMFTEELTFSIRDGLQCNAIQGSLIPMIKAYMADNYKLMEKLPVILREALFGSGAYAVACIPENSVDDLINGSSTISRESLSPIMDKDGAFKPLGFLGSTQVGNQEGDEAFSMEGLLSGSRFNATNLTQKNITLRDGSNSFVLPNVHVTDNPNALKMPGIIRRQATESANALINKQVGIEGFYNKDRTSSINDRELTSLLYRNNQRSQRPIIKVKTNNELKRYTVGKPLVLKLPTESVINCFPPGQPEKPIGHFVLLDSEGNPLSRRTHADHFDRMRTLSNNTPGSTSNDMSSFLLNKAGTAMGGGTCTSMNFQDASRIYGEMVEADLLARLRNGIYGSEISISQNEEVYRLMLSRSLSQQYTQVLFIPAEMITYFALSFNDDGSGKSLLEDARIIGAMRGQLLFARVMAAVKNSIGRRKVNIEHDPEDPDPQSTNDMIMAEVLRAVQHISPASSINPTDILNQVQTMGIEFQMSGSSRLPQTKIDFSESNTAYPEPDSALEEDMRERMLSGVGVPAELIDSASQPEFATTAISQHLLLAKRVRTIQDVFTPLLTQHARQLAFADGHFIIALKQIIEENLDKISEVTSPDDEIVKLKDNPQLLVHILAMEFISNFEISLAKPDVKTLSSQTDAIEAHERLYDATLKYFLGDEALDKSFIGEEAANRLSQHLGAVKAAFMRRWFGANGITPELFELTSLDEEGRPAFDVSIDVINHAQAIAKTLNKVISKAAPVADASDEQIQNTVGSEEPSLDTSLDTADSSTDASGDDMGLGDFDFPD